jgi:hypothetical protein
VKVRLLDGVAEADLVGVGENESEPVNVVEVVPVSVREVLGVVKSENVFDNVEVSDDVGEADRLVDIEVEYEHDPEENVCVALPLRLCE